MDSRPTSNNNNVPSESSKPKGGQKKKPFFNKKKNPSNLTSAPQVSSSLPEIPGQSTADLKPVLEQVRHQDDSIPQAQKYPVIIPVTLQNLYKDSFISHSYRQSFIILEQFRNLAYAEYKGLFKDLEMRSFKLDNSFHMLLCTTLAKQMASYAFTYRSQTDSLIQNLIHLNMDVPAICHQIAQQIGHAERQGRRLIIDDAQTWVHRFCIMVIALAQGHSPIDLVSIMPFVDYDEDLDNYKVSITSELDAVVQYSDNIWKDILEEVGSVNITMSTGGATPILQQVPLELTLSAARALSDYTAINPNSPIDAIANHISMRFQAFGINIPGLAKLFVSAYNSHIPDDLTVGRNLANYLNGKRSIHIFQEFGKIRLNLHAVVQRLSRNLKLNNTSDLEGRGNLAQCVVRRTLEDGGQTIVETPFEVDSATVSLGVLFGLGVKNDDYQALYRGVISWDIDASVTKYLRGMFVKH